ncbi:GNAT family N-acetyltransferase [Thalassospira marina]|uniref:L-ornithine N(alpha)-acyltransferase n=1 Tax=Thalassospira marina TaxID=2048283 RepID=A0ABN5FJ82_9PROT|nr:GNAT family N-acyltransferase [Thalassospira marina]AUG54732.1 hemolysin-like protein [Thalassospira marina]
MSDVRQQRLEVRLAQSEAEILASQRLRYKVFYEERGAQPSAEMIESQRDFDHYDPICDHLLVIDHGKGEGADGVVGTYRLLRQSVANKNGGFYSADEYQIDSMLAAIKSGEIMELGRSCVEEGYRTMPTLQLLWQGIAKYVFEHDIKLMFGCASFHGTDPDDFSDVLTYLHHNHLAPEGMRPRAVAERYESMARASIDAIDARQALRDLPPLIKGYLRLGGYVGDGAVVDHQFNTTDICIVLPTEKVTERYYKHYERTARVS